MLLTASSTNRNPTGPGPPPSISSKPRNELVLKADLPDVDAKKDIDVRVENQTLTLAGQRKFDKQESGKGFHRIERSYGNFVRSFARAPAFVQY